MFRFTSLTLMLSSLLSAQNFHDFDQHQHCLTREEVQKKIEKYLEKDPSTQEFYQLTEETLVIGDLTHGQVDYVLSLSDQPAPPKKRTASGLKHRKIALDPGHFGGEFATLEQRFVALCSPEKSLRLQEGDLTYWTALELKCLLEEAGAEVMITRSDLGKGAIEYSFFDWLESHPEIDTSHLSLSEVFRKFYNREDLRKRAEKINAFSPDLTIVLHYNTHQSLEEKKQKNPLTKSQYTMAFVPGAFMKGELNTAENRYEFLRLIVSDHVEQSIILSSLIVERLAERLNIPPVGVQEHPRLLETSCLLQAQGVYSRNLLLTRCVHSPVCYGEALVQNHEEEIDRLAKRISPLSELPYPERIQEVAQAYFDGIQDYCNRF